MSYLFRSLGALLIASLMLAGCGGNSKESVESAPAKSMAPSATSAAPFDRSFIDAMVPHHRSAIEMAIAAEKAGLSQPALIGLATGIVEMQQEEVDLMLAWRRQWYGSATVDPDAGVALGLSESEMGMAHSAVDISTADDVDAAFASMMIDHHKGAIAMAEKALIQAKHSELKRLARRIIQGQSAEIATMEPHARGMGGSAGVNHGG